MTRPGWDKGLLRLKASGRSKKEISSRVTTPAKRVFQHGYDLLHIRLVTCYGIPDD